MEGQAEEEDGQGHPTHLIFLAVSPPGTGTGSPGCGQRLGLRGLLEKPRGRGWDAAAPPPGPLGPLFAPSRQMLSGTTQQGSLWAVSPQDSPLLPGMGERVLLAPQQLEWVEAPSGRGRPDCPVARGVGRAGQPARVGRTPSASSLALLAPLKLSCSLLKPTLPPCSQAPGGPHTEHRAPRPGPAAHPHPCLLCTTAPTSWGHSRHTLPCLRPCLPGRPLLA